MKPRDSVEVSIRDGAGAACGRIVISLLPPLRNERVPPLLDLTGTPEHDPATEPIQVLEGYEYRYELELNNSKGHVTTDKPEIFAPDTTQGMAGRLRPGLHTGWLSVRFFTNGHEVGRAALEVRSRKLDYTEHYQWMLRDIANQFTEVVMERFAATEQRFHPGGDDDAITVYQQFAFLRSLLDGGEFQAAIQQIIARPYVSWETKEEIRPVGRGFRFSSRLSRQLAGPGPRVSLDPPRGSLHSLPRFVSVSRTEVTVDNAPNRFAKFALESWRDIAVTTAEILSRQKPTAAIRRGLRETEALEGDLEALLSAEVFREIGPLEHFPTGNQVLQKREGYRDLFRAYAQFDIAAKLSWKALEEGYRAGQRNVATLYEYWVFLQLARIVAEFCSSTFDIGSLLESDGLSIGLKRGHETIVEGETAYLGRRLHLTLAFNRSFNRSQADTAEGSWTLQLRPDCSLKISSEEEENEDFVPVWLHFDAKYRVDTVREALSANAVDDSAGVSDRETETRTVGAAKEDDIMKMHAYRDAIKRTAGAYVVYPGEEYTNQPRRETWPEYHEILPGLGAFALRPSKFENEQPEGASSLRSFIKDVIQHTGSQITRHERGRYWTSEIYSNGTPREKAVQWASFLSRPAADTWVALVNLESQHDLAWIQKHKLLPISVDRATQQPEFDSRVLTSDIVVVYGALLPSISLFRAAGEPEVVSGAGLKARGFARTDSQFYYCLRMEEVTETVWSRELSLGAILRTRQRHKPGATPGTPIAVTWLDLVLE